MSTLKDLAARDGAFVAHTYARQQAEFARGEGARLWDSSSAEYLDMLSGLGVANAGHCHPAIVAAIRRQAATLIHASNLYFSEPAVALAQRLAQGSLGGRVFLCNSGAEANEAALKLARKAKPHGEVVVLHGAFHGRTFGALSATPQESKQAPFAPLVPGFQPVAADAAAVAAAVGPRTAAVLLEPVQGETGVHPISDEVLLAARAACDEHGAALIFDEVQTGLGRTGSLWAYEQTAVVPDAITSAKALAGGLPAGALITGPRYADTFAPGDHGTTFGGGPLVSAAALASLDVLEDPALHSRVRALGELLLHGLAELPHVRSTRGRGLMLAADVDVDAPAVVVRALTQQRLVINATGPHTIRLLPPLVITEEQAQDALARLRTVLETA